MDANEKIMQEAVSQMNNVTLRIAKLIGSPINENLPLSAAISEIADTDTAEPGEKVFYFANRDDDPDEIYYVNTSTGAMVTVERSPVSDTELTFQGLNSRIEYVLVDTILASPDTKVLGRKKEHIAMGMDKLELKLIIDALIASGDVSEIAIPSGGDLYDVLVDMKHAVEDYGDDFVLLAGTAVKEKLDTYDKDQVASFNYRIGIKEMLAASGIKVKKIFGVVKSGNAAANVGDSGTESRLLDTNKCILVARNSTIADGKPLAFVRRKISADIAKLMGADVDDTQRALIVNPTPVNVAGTNTLAYGIFGYESIIWAIKNRKAVVKSADLTTVV